MLEVDVAHVDSEATGLGILLVFEDDGVGVQGLLVEAVGVVHIGQVVEDVEGEVDVHLVKSASVLSQLTDFLFLGSCFLCLG